MSRQSDVFVLAAVEPASGALPAIDWASVGHTAPTPVEQPARRPTDPLPKADVVVITWTNAEWSALDHVFANSDSSRSAGLGSWTQDWLAYSRDTGSYSTGIRADPLWGVFRVVTIQGATQPRTVLLFRSNAHLQYPPYIAGLRAMVQAVLTDPRATPWPPTALSCWPARLPTTAIQPTARRSPAPAGRRRPHSFLRRRA